MGLRFTRRETNRCKVYKEGVYLDNRFKVY